MRGIIALLFALLLGASAQAQDSLRIYTRLDSLRQKGKVWRFLHEAVLTEPPDARTGTTAGPRTKRERDPFLALKGDTIIRIHITVLDPFGNTVLDTACCAGNALERIGNAWHIRTRAFVVQNALLFKAGELFDPVLRAESERILRTLPMVNDARITAHRVGKDQAVVRVVVHDRWSLDGAAELSGGSPRLSITEKNLLGFGHTLSENITYDATRSRIWSDGAYSIGNIDGSFISTTVDHAMTEGTDQLGLRADRGFISPLTRWAGGLAGRHAWYHERSESDAYQARLLALDTWGGLQVGRPDSCPDALRTTLAARFRSASYAQQVYSGTYTARADERLYLMSISHGRRSFVQDRYLFRFGSTEDVVEGWITTFTTGLSWTPGSTPLPYSSIVGRQGGYGRSGNYTAWSVGAGNSWGASGPCDVIGFADVQWFSRVLSVGRWRFRQFARVVGALGINSSRQDQFTLEPQQLAGFERSDWRGDRKLLLRTETVCYLPYNLAGFRFAPVFIAAVGHLRSYRSNHPEWQPAFGLGLIIRNERLVVNTFHISVGFYPPVVGGDARSFQWNALESLAVRPLDLSQQQPDLLYAP